MRLAPNVVKERSSRSESTFFVGTCDADLEGVRATWAPRWPLVSPIKWWLAIWLFIRFRERVEVAVWVGWARDNRAPSVCPNASLCGAIDIVVTFGYLLHNSIWYLRDTSFLSTTVTLAASGWLRCPTMAKFWISDDGQMGPRSPLATANLLI